MTREELYERLDDILAEIEDSYVPVTHIISGKSGYCLVNPKNKHDVLFVPEHPTDVFDPATNVSWSEVNPRLSPARREDFREFIYRATRKNGMVGGVSIPNKYLNSKAISKIFKLIKENSSLSFAPEFK